MKEGTKICSKCGEDKSIEDFRKDKSRKDGFQYICKQCAEQYYQNNKKQYFSKTAKRRTNKFNQTPITIYKQTINQLYSICIEINEILDDVYFHVDHIQPLSKGGLHHQDNLQILEAELNLEKHAKWPLTDEEQIRY